MKGNKNPFIVPNIVLPYQIQSIRPVYVGGNQTAEQPLLQMWPRPLVLWSPAPPNTSQPSVPLQADLTSSNSDGDVEIATENTTSDVPGMRDANTKWIPQADMLFESENEAYDFYNTYAEKVGFLVRRSTLWTTSKNIITRRTFVCSKEGFREKKKGSKEAKCPRPETRIGCPASMTIRLTPNGKYRVTEFVPNHNHQLATLATIQMSKAKKIRCKARLARANLVDETVKTPEFETEDEAYEFYSMYAGRIGFTVRRASMTISAENVITRRMFVCSREGFRENKKGARRVKKPRPETRTGCPACMIIRTTPNGKYRVTEFVTYHNHQLASSGSTDLITSGDNQDDFSDGDMDMADGSADDSVGKIDRSPTKSTVLPPDNNSALRSKRSKAIAVGDAGATMEYLQKMQELNPSFFYAVQVDEDDNMTNFFWADAQSMLDFNYFGDVVCFDTTYKIHDYGRPLSLFTGVNHHKQTTVFGAALIYDDSLDSLKWLFETFKIAMGGRQPKTILTDRCRTTIDAIAAVWPGTAHRFCVWHIYQDATEQLSQAFHGSRTLGYDFSRCLFDCEDDEEFLSAWKAMCEKYELKDNQWLARLFEDKEKWALAYGREAFYADMRSVQQKESLSSELKKFLDPETQLLDFFENYEKILAERRFAELRADVQAGQLSKKPPSMRMLKQAANAYTPAAYKMFEREFELYMDCMLYSLGDVETVSEYKVILEEKPKDHFVKFDSLDGSLTCSCKMFEFIGIQCRHVLKVLDTRNIKELPSQYILKRWRKDAKSRAFQDHFAFSFEGDPQLSMTKRYNYLCRMFSIAAAAAAKTAESYDFMENQSASLLEQLEQLLPSRPSEVSTLMNTSCDRLQNPVEGMVSESLRYDKTNQTNFMDATAHGLFGSRQAHPAMCWGQFPAGPTEQ